MLERRESMTDSEICRLLQESPDKGFKALFDEYHGYVYTIVFSILKNFSSRDVEECTTDVLSDVALSFDAAHNSVIKPYIAAAARNRAIDRYHRLSNDNKVISFNDEVTKHISSGEDTEADVESAETAKLLLEKIKMLGKPNSDIIVQKYYFGRNSFEIAKILKMNPVTVRSSLRRSMKKLKKLLSDMDITI